MSSPFHQQRFNFLSATELSGHLGAVPDVALGFPTRSREGAEPLNSPENIDVVRVSADGTRLA